MTPRYEKIVYPPTQSFRAEEWRMERFEGPWHFHPEIELTLIVSGQGQRMVGDSLEPFSKSDLVLLGPEVPHVWQSLKNDHNQLPAIATVIQFHRDFLGTDFWQCPELAPICHLLDCSRLGLVFPEEISTHLRAEIRRIPKLKGFPALVALLKLLGKLSTASINARPLCSLNYAPSLNPEAGERIARVIAYASQNLDKSPRLTELAQVAAMTPPAFSRYFKSVTGRSPTDFLSDLRIEQCARLLRETGLPITRIAEMVGFSTITSFNRRFKERMHSTPRDYRKAFRAASLQSIK